jgi:hypothetical protein
MKITYSPYTDENGNLCGLVKYVASEYHKHAKIGDSHIMVSTVIKDKRRGDIK